MRALRALPPGGEPIRAADAWRAASGGRGALERFRAALRDYLAVPHVALTSSGTAALAFALKALKALRPERVEVILPAYTCPNVLSAVVLAGLRPVLCDVSPEGTGLEADGLRRALGPATLAVVAVHLLGIPANVDEVAAAVRKQGAFLVEDAAQAFGNESGGRRLGTLGDVGVFSFGRGKPLTLGAGGAVVTASDEIAEALRGEEWGLDSGGFGGHLARALLYGAFFRPGLYWLPRALPFLHLGETIFSLDIPLGGMNDFTAALGARLLPRYEAAREERSRRAEALLERLADGRTVTPLGSPGKGNAHLRLPLLVEEGRRDELLARLGRLGATGMYPVPLDEQPGTAPHLGGRREAGFPNAKRLSRSLLTLPLHGYLREGDLREIEQALHGTVAAPVAETT